MHTAWLEPRDLASDLEGVDKGIAAIFAEEPSTAEICGYLFHAGGKRLRPAMLFLSARLGTADTSQCIPMGVAIELLHTATLLHDDVVDAAETRRHRPSVNARWGNRMATFAGGHLFARAMQVFASAGDAINRTVCEAIEEIWRGQTRETQNAYRLDVDERAYLDTIASKTATLYELACRIGAVLGRLSQPQADTLATYGRDVGIGFQLIDDVLDVVGDERALGKPHASDIRGGIYTLPVIHALSQKNERAQQLGAILSRRDPPPDLLDEAIAIVRSNGAITYSLRTATAILERARDRLDGFPPSDAAQALRKLPGDILRSVSDQA